MAFFNGIGQQLPGVIPQQPAVAYTGPYGQVGPGPAPVDPRIAITQALQNLMKIATQLNAAWQAYRYAPTPQSAFQPYQPTFQQQPTFPQYFGGQNTAPPPPGVSYELPPAFIPPYANPGQYATPRGGAWGYGGVPTPAPYTPPTPPPAPYTPPVAVHPTYPSPTSGEINTNIDFTKLSAAERSKIGLNDRDRAILHLWGIQMSSRGFQDGGVLLNVIGSPEKFKPAEVALAMELKQDDESIWGAGKITGKSLDAQFFAVFKKITGTDVPPEIRNSPAKFASERGAVDLENREKLNAQGQFNNGLSGFENAVLRLWGHEPLFNGGRIDGSILSYSLNSPTALDFGLNKGDIQALLSADLASDGVRNGDSLATAFGDVLKQLYLGGSNGTSADKVTEQAQLKAAQIRTFGTQFPPGGDPVRYQQFVQALGPDLAHFDANLNEISGLAGVVPQQANLDGRFENGLFMRYPTDQREFASYLQAQVAGGALQGKTDVRQKDAIPGTRFAQVEDPTQWHASVARAYAYQFVGQALEYGKPPAERGAFNPLTADGLANAANAFETLTPDARVFTQVASVFKGNLMGGPGLYDNQILKELLLSKNDPQLTALANEPQVGQTDVQTIGAITNAISSGKLTLKEVIASGTISQKDMPRYMQIIGYVTDGSLNQDLGRFDANPLRDNLGNAIPNTGGAGSSGLYFGGPIDPTTAGVGGVNGLYNSFTGPNPHQARLDQLKADPVVKGFYALFDLNGDGSVRGPEAGAMVSNMHDLINLMLSGAQPGPNAPAAVRNFFFAHDFNRDGQFSVAEVRQAIQDLSPVLESVKLDQFSGGRNSGKEVQYGPPLGINPNGDISRCPVLGPLQKSQK